jgi:hypothetical protein
MKGKYKMRLAKWGSLLAICGLLAALLTGQVDPTRDIYEAARDHKIDIEVRGDGIERINGKVSRRPGSGPMIVRIPPGTLFEAGSGGVQNMVVTEGTSVDLTTSTGATFTAAVACSDLHLSVPGEDDRFRVARLPARKAEVVKFFPVAERAGASYETKQAGIWIVTDDANYEDLGILVGGFFGGGPRAINEDEAANAMMLLEKSGIDVTSRSIWNDRLSVCESVITKPSSASGWCGKVFRETTDASWKISTLEGDSPAVVRKIARTSLLQAKDEDSKTTLINAANTHGSVSDSVLVIVAQALGNFKGTDVGDALLPMLKDKPASVTAAAIQSLTRIKDLRSPEAVRPLVEEAEPLAVRLASIHCLGGLGSSNDDLAALEDALKDKNQQVRTAAGSAMQQVKKRMRSVQ